MQSLPRTILSAGDLDACVKRIQRGVALRKTFMNSSEPNVPYAEPLIDAINLFERLSIGYALVGGVAAMYYGRARFTEDLDFVATTGHGEVLATNPEVMKQLHFDPTCTYKLYHDSGVEIDLWKDEHCDEIIGRSAEARLAGRSIRIADPHDLIAMKLRAGRLQDDYDISEILRRQTIDEQRVRSLVNDDEYAHYLTIKQRTKGTH